MVPVGTWTLETWTGSAGDFHATEPRAERTVWDVHVTAPAVVLGSSQQESELRAGVLADRAVGSARRHSGGGAVWVSPADTFWVDVVIPRGDPLWVDDVPGSSMWLGEILAGLIGDGATVHTGRWEPTDTARAYCFGGLAAGEVVGPHGKIVGISQRRTRGYARFQCVAYTSYDPVLVSGFFTDPAVASAVAALTVQTLGVNPADLLAGLLARLPD